jgi:O-methyltransferase domain/Dimerisation domain
VINVSQNTATNDMSPAVLLRQLSTGFWITQAIAVAAKLGIADHLQGGTKGCAELASALGVHAGALYRLLRGLASVGVFAEEAHGRFTLTPLAALLLTAGPGSWRAAALLNGEPWAWQPWGALAYSVQTGRPAFEHIFGMGFDAYLAQHPDAADTFQTFLQVATAEEAMMIAPTYDFSGLTSVVDVGGGRGALLAAILRRYPHLRGILFDAPPVLADALPVLEAQGVADRCTLVAGDFFQALPGGADVYLLKWILVSWDDVSCVTILQNCRQALGVRGRVVIIERLIPPGNEPCFGKLADLNLLVMYQGRHRTEAEYRDLFARADLALAQIIPTQSPTEFSLIEAIPR